jgi:hypothetical protein
MRVLTSSHSDHRSSARRCFGRFVLPCIQRWMARSQCRGYWRRRSDDPQTGSTPACIFLLLLGTVASAAGIWVKLWNPSCSVVSGV